MHDEVKSYALNDYQQLMLKITDLLPYNAIHAIKLKKNKDDILTVQIKLEQAIRYVIKTLNLGIPVFFTNRKKVYFEYCHQIHLTIIENSLTTHVNNEMNSSFHEKELPFRFFLVLTEKDVYFSVTYNHWIADAYGISRLMEVVLKNYDQEYSSKLCLSSKDMHEYFPNIHGSKAWIYRITGIISNFWRFSSAYRIPIREHQRFECGSSFYFFSSEILPNLKNYCKQQGITLNDFFVAILAKLFGELTVGGRMNGPQKLFKPKRNQIIIAIISNIRQHSIISLDYVFNLFLGFFYLSFKSPEKLSFQALTQSVHLQTEYFKKNRIALKQSLLFKIQNWFWDKKKNPQSKYRLFFKNTPITVGISNMDMRHFQDNSVLELERYIRFSPTAIICPMAFNLTSFNGHLSLGINFNKGFFDDKSVKDIQLRFVNEIISIITQQKMNLSCVC